MTDWHFHDCIEYKDGTFEAIYTNYENDEVFLKPATPAQIKRATSVCQYCGGKGQCKDGCETPIFDLNAIFSR